MVFEFAEWQGCVGDDVARAACEDFAQEGADSDAFEGGGEGGGAPRRAVLSQERCSHDGIP